MKILIYVTLCLFFVAPALSCEGEAYFIWLNPNGTAGGKVSYSARVHSSVEMDPLSSICGNAWVESNVILSDGSVIQDQAWVGPYVELGGHSKVSGEASLQGISPNHKVIVSDNVQIFGNAKLKGRITVSDKAKIYGQAKVSGYSSISGTAEVCEDITLSDKEGIADDYYCFKGGPSRGTVTKTGIQINGYNAPTFEWMFKIKGTTLHNDRTLFKMYIDGVELEPSNLTIWADQIKIRLEDLEEGDHLLKWRMIDKDQKIIEGEENFIVGHDEINLFLNHSPEILKIEILDEVGVKPLSYKREAGGNLRVLGIPSSQNPLLRVFSVNSQSFVLKHFRKSSAPEELNAVPFSTPQSQVNEDFSLGLAGWNDFGDGSATVVQSGSKPKLSLNAAPGGGHLVTTTIPIVNEGRNFESEIYLATNYVAGLDQVASVILYNKTTKELKLDSFASDLNRNRFIDSITPGQARSFGARTYLEQLNEGDQASVVLSFENITEPSEFHQSNGSESEGTENFPITFTPIAFRYVSPGEGFESSIARAYPEEASDSWCENSAITQAGVSYNTDVMTYLSVGDFPSYVANTPHNRVYGTIRIRSGESISGIRLAVLDNTGNIVASAPLGRCVRELYESNTGLNFDIAQDRREKFYLAAFPEIMLPLGALPNLQIVFRRNGNDVSSRSRLTALRDLALSNSYLYSTRDNYDSTVEGFAARGGGDTWGLAEYVDRHKQILEALRNYDSSWKINDLTLMNGGSFAPHNTHKSGQQGDYKFLNMPGTGLQYDLKSNGSPAANYSIADHLKESFSFISNHFPYIKLIGIQPDLDGTSGQGNLQSQFWKVFSNTCLGDTTNSRFVSGTGLNSSFLKVLSGHRNHMHIELNSSDGVTVPRTNIPAVSQAFDQSKFIFKITESSTSKSLTVKAAPNSELGDLSYYFRMRSGYDLSFNDKVYTGKVGASTKSRRNKGLEYFERKRDVFDFRYAQIVAVNAQGGCKTEDFEIDETKLCKDKNGKIVPWYYHKNPDDSYVVVAEGVQVDSASVIGPNVKLCSPGVKILNSTITGDAEIQPMTAPTSNTEVKLTIQNSNIQAPQSTRFKTESNVKIKVDGTLGDLSTTGKVNFEGFIDVYKLKITNPASSDQSVKITNTIGASNKTQINEVEITGYPEIISKVGIFQYKLNGFIKIIGKDVPGIAVNLSDNGEITSTATSAEDPLIIDASERTPIYITKTTINGKPTIKYGLHFDESEIIGDGIYEGLNNEWSDDQTHSYLKGRFEGANSFKGFYITWRGLKNSTIENTPIEIGTYRVSTVLDLRVFQENIEDVVLKGAVSVQGELGNGVELEGIPNGNDALNIFTEPGTSILGTDTVIKGTLYAEGTTRIEPQLDKHPNLDLTSTQSGPQASHFKNASVRGTDTHGGGRIWDSTVVLGTLNDFFRVEQGSSLKSVTLFGTSCVLSKTWSNQTRSNVPCDAQSKDKYDGEANLRRQLAVQKKILDRVAARAELVKKKIKLH